MPRWNGPVRLVTFGKHNTPRVLDFFRYPEGLTVLIYKEGLSPHPGNRATPYPGVRVHTVEQAERAQKILRGGYATGITDEEADILIADDPRWEQHIVREE